ncbi:MAG: F0F1 ATP synthase subunit B [Planctomycetota bacterium]
MLERQRTSSIWSGRRTARLVGGALAFLPTLALAAEGGDQPDLSQPVLPTMAWTVIVFVIVLLILWKKAWGPLLKALDERERKIRESLTAAERAQAEIRRAQEEHEKVLAEARRQATAVVEEGKRDADAVKERIVAEARQASEELKTRALADINRAKDNAVHEIHQRAVQLSMVLTEKLIKKTLKPEDHKALVDEAIDRYQKLS